MKKNGYITDTTCIGGIGCEWMFDRVETPDALVTRLWGCEADPRHGFIRNRPDDIKMRERRALLGCMEARR